MLRLTIQNLGDVTIFRCEGRITFAYADRLRIGVLKQRHVRVVVLDLAEVSAIDAAGIGILVSLRNWAGINGTRLKLMNLTPRVEDPLELTHLKSVFETCSVAEMLGLLCRAFEQSQFVNVDAAIEDPDSDHDEGEQVLAQSA